MVLFKSMTTTILPAGDIINPICPFDFKRNMVQLLHKGKIPAGIEEAW